jgi:hypothetical protein
MPTLAEEPEAVPVVAAPAPTPTDPAPVAAPVVVPVVAAPPTDPAPVVGPSVEDQIAAALAKRDLDHRTALEAARLEGAAAAKAEAEDVARRAALTEQARLEEDLRVQSEAAATSRAELAAAKAEGDKTKSRLEFVRALAATSFTIVKAAGGEADPDVEAIIFDRVQKQVEAGATYAIALDAVRHDHPALFAPERTAGPTSTTRPGAPGTSVPPTSPVQAPGVGNVFDLKPNEWAAKQAAIGAV